jgi:hypothetical protein
MTRRLFMGISLITDKLQVVLLNIIRQHSHALGPVQKRLERKYLSGRNGIKKKDRFKE